MLQSLTSELLGVQMDTTHTLIERLRAHWGGATNYGLAKRLGITKSAVTRYARHGGGMSLDIGLRVADELKLNRTYVLACLMAEREPKDSVTRAVLESLVILAQRPGKTASSPARAKRVSKVAGVLIGAGFAALSAFTPPQAQASNYAASVYYGE
jgi:predicted transcriptional regulator